mgnify:CR=1 FL=1
MSFDSAAYLRTEHAQHVTVANDLLAKVAEPFDKLVRVVTDSLNKGGKILFFGRSEEHTSEL